MKVKHSYGDGSQNIPKQGENRWETVFKAWLQEYSGKGQVD